MQNLWQQIVICDGLGARLQLPVEILKLAEGHVAGGEGFLPLNQPGSIAQLQEVVQSFRFCRLRVIDEPPEPLLQLMSPPLNQLWPPIHI